MHRQGVYEFLNLSWIVDIREIEKTIIIVGPGGLEPLPKGRDLQSRCRIRTTFRLQFLYLVVESNHFPLHVKQIRFRYANKVKCMFLNFLLINIQTKYILYREMVTLHSKVGYEPSPVT